MGKLFRISTIFALLGSSALAGDFDHIGSFNTYGTPGIIDLPSANMAPDATISTTISRFETTNRTTLTFQISPRLTGSFRYSALRDYDSPASVDGVYYDRSFDIRYQLMKESGWRPAISVGLQDFMGTGLLGAEYIVATKNFNNGLTISGGLGWGRLGSYNALGSTGSRPTQALGQGGIPSYDTWFRGNFAPFFGASYQATDRLRIKAEYSSDNYNLESRNSTFEKTSPWNVGIDYQLGNKAQASLFYLHGNTIGAQLSFHIDPVTPPISGGLEKAPLPVKARKSANDLGWTVSAPSLPKHRALLVKLLASEGLTLTRFEPSAHMVKIWIENDRHFAEAQALGRAARILSQVMPDSIEVFEIYAVVTGMPITKASINRKDLERYENAPASEMAKRVEITDAFEGGRSYDDSYEPKFSWGFGPAFGYSLFDPEEPFRLNVGVSASATYKLRPNLILSGSISKSIGGNLDELDPDTETNLPKVRTNFGRYIREGDPGIDHLTIAHYGRPAANIYSRVTAGYLETMYGGISGEVLWKKPNSRLALGAELNLVKQRAFDKRFSFQDYEILMGHVSAYYDFGKGYNAQLDVGRYLAGDYGATISIDRQFANGWKIGAYATFTDVTSEDFGEGSFDKGIILTIPIAWASGQATRKTNQQVIRSLTRDGGAQLRVQGRLYDRVRDYHVESYSDSWGRYWR